MRGVGGRRGKRENINVLCSQPGMIAGALIPALKMLRLVSLKFEVNLIYRASFRATKAT